MGRSTRRRPWTIAEAKARLSKILGTPPVGRDVEESD